ncbi:MAG TPA: hypothetical protein VH475_04630 [Tepidisphaeraceae bacterium]
MCSSAKRLPDGSRLLLDRLEDKARVKIWSITKISVAGIVRTGLATAVGEGSPW